MIMNLGIIPKYRNLTTPRRIRKMGMASLALSPPASLEEIPVFVITLPPILTSLDQEVSIFS